MKSKLISRILLALFLILSITQIPTVAQVDTNRTDRTTTDDDDDNILGMGDDDENSPKYQFADKMAKSLMSRLNLQLEQTEKIRDVLIDYQEDVLDAKEKYVFDNNRVTGTDRTPGVTGTDRTVTDDDATDDDESLIGGTDENDKMEAYQDADREANDAIEDALEEEQIPQYNNVKKEWWAEIKSHVHSIKIDTDDDKNTRKNNTKDNTR